ncbi:MAG: tetratricopeptide repeat protein, partial [Deltaproteobacteria bacterium]
MKNKNIDGDAVPKDPVKAFEWYLKAAGQGDAHAQCSLGYCYYQGAGVTKDLKKAADWYRKAAEQGQVDAR